MKKWIAGLIAAGMFVAGSANALPGQVTTYYYYSGTQLVGQSLGYCNNVLQHWGDAPDNGGVNAIAVTYACGTGSAIDVSYPTNIDPWLRTNFCSTVNACGQGPTPVGGHTLLPGRYSS
jgi:hypothetical protein